MSGFRRRACSEPFARVRAGISAAVGAGPPVRLRPTTGRPVDRPPGQATRRADGSGTPDRRRSADSSGVADTLRGGAGTAAGTLRCGRATRHRGMASCRWVVYGKPGALLQSCPTRGTSRHDLLPRSGCRSRRPASRATALRTLGHSSPRSAEPAAPPAERRAVPGWSRPRRRTAATRHRTCGPLPARSVPARPDFAPFGHPAHPTRPAGQSELRQP